MVSVENSESFSSAGGELPPGAHRARVAASKVLHRRGTVHRQKRLDLIIDVVYYKSVGAAANAKKPESDGALSEEMIAFVDHLAELLAEEFVRAMKEDDDAGGGVCEVLEREPAGAEH